MADMGSGEPSAGKRTGRGSRSPGHPKNGQRQTPDSPSRVSPPVLQADGERVPPGGTDSCATAVLNRLREAAAARDGH